MVRTKPKKSPVVLDYSIDDAADGRWFERDMNETSICSINNGHSNEPSRLRIRPVGRATNGGGEADDQQSDHNEARSRDRGVPGQRYNRKERMQPS
jgi:hypothetical protein